MIAVPDNPAGRLRALFGVVHDAGDTHTVTSWWQLIAETVAPEGDVHSVRAEAAALFRDVELTADLFSADDERDAYLFHRTEWSKGIFAWGLESTQRDGNNAVYKAEEIVSAESVRWLSAISSILHRDAPDFRLKADIDADTIVAKIAGDLRQLLADIKGAEDSLHPALRAAIVRRITTALEDVTYIRLRGWQSLHRNSAAVEVTLSATEQAPTVQADEPLRERVKQWVETARIIVTEIERIVVPAATGVAVAISTSDVAVGLSALVTARGAIEYAAARGRVESGPDPRELPPSEGDSAPQEN